MAKICLPNNIAQGFRQALKSGVINPDKLSNMTSKERNEFFKKIVGEEYATMTNSLFESKLLLQNQKQGLITWAKTVAGLKPEVRNDLLSRVNKLQNALTPENTDTFLNDFVNTKLGVNVTDKEAGDIARLAQDAMSAKEAMESAPRRGLDQPATPEEITYGIKTIELNDYVNDLKVRAERVSPMELILNPKAAATEAASLTKSLTSSFDNSALLRQGMKTLFSNPREFIKNAPKTFSDIKKVFSGKDAQKILNAEIISDPMYDTMKRAGLAVGAIEEAFPSRAPGMLPIFGKFFKASDAAYSGFLHRMRADLFKKYITLAESQGVNINSKAEIESIAKMINSLTGRGHLGSLEKNANVVNIAFFSPRNLKSNIDFLTAQQFQKGVTPFVRKQAAINLMKTIAGIGSILAIANTLRPGSVEIDPRSSNFGKIKVGNTRFDVAGGMAGYETLLARMLTNSTKSSTSGKITELGGKGFKPTTRFDVLLDFFTNKFSPLLSQAKQYAEGQTFEGEDPTIVNSLKEIFLPLSINTLLETKEERDRANLLVIALAEFFGIGTSTY